MCTELWANHRNSVLSPGPVAFSVIYLINLLSVSGTRASQHQIPLIIHTFSLFQRYKHMVWGDPFCLVTARTVFLYKSSLLNFLIYKLDLSALFFDLSAPSASGGLLSNTQFFQNTPLVLLNYSPTFNNCLNRILI